MKTALDIIQIPKPCLASWADMVGDDTKRYCGHCEQNVYNLAALTADEGAALLQQHEGNVCVRLYRRLDGTVVTADCQPPRRRLLRYLSAAATLLTAFVSGCDKKEIRFCEQGKPVDSKHLRPSTPTPEVLDIPPREVPPQ